MIAEIRTNNHLPPPDLSASAAPRHEPARHGEFSCVKTGVLDSSYELRSGSRLFAGLSLSGFFSPSAVVTSDHGSWIFAAEGKSVVVRSQESLRDLATLDLSFSDHGGILRFPDGRVFLFSSDFWKGRAELQTPSGTSLVRYRFHGFLRPSARIELLGSGFEPPELPWLLALGWSLVIGYF